VSGSYDLELVLLSIVVAMMASYSALDLAGRVTLADQRAARYWLLGGAFAMGAGIWSMHFIGMLAFSLPIPLAYDPAITLASLVIAIATSYFALWVVSRPTLGAWLLLTAGFIMGAGICAMHYTGMAAMRMSPPIRYEPLLFTASVLIAISASIVALFLAFTLRTRSTGRGILYRALSAMVMGFAIAGMHYTGMAAAIYERDSICLARSAFNLDRETLSYGIALAIMSLLALTLVAAIFDARMASQTMRMLHEVERANRELKKEIAERTRIEALMLQQTQELERSNKELEQFAYVASHDLQAPLRGISGFAQLLRRYEPGMTLDKEAEEFIQFIVDGTKNMQQMIQSLLDYSRAGRGGVNRKLVTLEQPVAQACENLRGLIDARHAQVEVKDLPILNIDPEQMTLVMQNLIENAIKFQPQDGPIVSIAARPDSNGWVISVTDQGIGIDAKHSERIFKMFQRLHTDETYTGSGIGLAICEKIVRMHGGRIWVDSRPNEGSTFSFLLPGTGSERSAQASQPA
jgi:diguanylate cyclase